LLKIVGTQEMRAIDTAATAKYGMPGLELMERAGRSLAEQARAMLEPNPRPKVAVLAGKGKNGGDGLVCARRLAGFGMDVSVILLTKSRLAPETAAMLKRLNPKKINITRLNKGFSEKTLQHFLKVDLVVDALLGIGASGSPREPAASVIRILNSMRVKVLAADLPSGLNADTGEAGRPTVRADFTLTFGLPKKGLFKPEAMAWVGPWAVDTIGFPRELLYPQTDDPAYFNDSDAADIMPRRSRDAHKRTAGKVLIIGGSAQYHGALLLAGRGAVRAGAGYVTLAYPMPLDMIVRQHVVEEICCPLPGDKNGDLAAAALKRLLSMAREQDAVVIGPGMGRASQVFQLVRAFIRKATGPRSIIVDADALSALAGIPMSRRSRSLPALILTPHEGEAGRLKGVPPEKIRAERWAATQELARRYQAVTLLKGPHTVVASPDGQLRIIGAGTPALATAGTGDVLSGAAAALSAQQLEPYDAAALAVYLHGRAGELAGPDPGGLGVRAREVADAIPFVLGQLRGNK